MRDRSSPATRSVAMPFLAGIVGGFLLAQWLNRLRASGPNFHAAEFRSSDPRDRRASSQQNEPEALLPMPSARLGATEEQMNHTMSPPGANPARPGEVSVAGATYEFDPGGITPG